MAHNVKIPASPVQSLIRYVPRGATKLSRVIRAEMSVKCVTAQKGLEVTSTDVLRMVTLGHILYTLQIPVSAIRYIHNGSKSYQLSWLLPIVLFYYVTSSF